MAVDSHITLVYSEKDDLPLEGDSKGWVTHFHKFLTLLLDQINREDLLLNLVKAEDLKLSDLEDTHATIAILSGSFIKEHNAVNYISGWAQVMMEDDSLVMDGIPKLLKVVKSPFDADKVFPELADVVNYDFYYVDSTTGEMREFSRFFGSEAEQSFWLKLVDIAYDISHILNLGGETKPEIIEKSDRSKTVYLANTGMDLLGQRDVIKRELKRHGYEVIPNHSLPKDLKSLEEMIRNDLADCRLSIHLVGEDYGYRPQGSDLSVVDIQNRIAHKHTEEMAVYNQKNNNEKPFSRLVWLSPDLKNVGERQRLFIEDLKSEAALFDEAEVLQVPLQELISIIREELLSGGRLSFIRDMQVSAKRKKDESKVVYLIADKRDLKDSNKLKEFLSKQGFMVLEPSYKGDITDIRTVHQENLRRCDGSIIYYGSATLEWIKTKLQDLLKAPGFGRERPIRAKAVYLEGKKEIDTSHFDKNKTLVLGNTDTFDSETLSPFITQLNN